MNSNDDEEEERLKNNRKREMEALELTAAVAAVGVASLFSVFISQQVAENSDSDSFDLRKLPRRSRTQYDHERVTQQL
jgi:hypothetical protein